MDAHFVGSFRGILKRNNLNALASCNVTFSSECDETQTIESERDRERERKKIKEMSHNEAINLPTNFL